MEATQQSVMEKQPNCSSVSCNEHLAQTLSSTAATATATTTAEANNAANNNNNLISTLLQSYQLLQAMMQNDKNNISPNSNQLLNHIQTQAAQLLAKDNTVSEDVKFAVKRRTETKTKQAATEHSTSDDEPPHSPSHLEISNNDEILDGEYSDESNSSLFGGSKLIRKGAKEVAKFQCGDCSFVTSRLDVFNQHVATHKNNEKEHECPECKQKFKYKQSVKKHMMKHEGITPYHCKICDYKTNSHSSLEVHQRAHSGEKPFVCDSCGMRFAQNSQLRVHIQYHSNANNPYKCELCDYQSPNYYKLTRHMKVHRERPYACDLCKKRFMLPYQLRNHAATHLKSNGKPECDRAMTCSGCNVVCRDRQKYTYHIRECPALKNDTPLAILPKPPKKPSPTPYDRSLSTSSNSRQDLLMGVNESTLLSDPSGTMTTEIAHPNNKVSRILHLPTKRSPTAHKQTGIKRRHDCEKVESTSSNSRTRRLSVTSHESNELNAGVKNVDEEHFESALNELVPNFEAENETKFDFHDDFVIIKPEAAPSDINWAENNLGYDFKVQIPDETTIGRRRGDSSTSSPPSSGVHSNFSIKSEHSSLSNVSSSRISPSAEIDSQVGGASIAEAIQSQMSIFDKFFFKSEYENNEDVSSEPILDLSIRGGENLDQSDEPTDDNILDLTTTHGSNDQEESNQSGGILDFSKTSSLTGINCKDEKDISNMTPISKSLFPKAIGQRYKLNFKVLSEEEAIIKTDNVERPFKCGYCGKQFIQSSHIRVHLQYHVNASNPFRCTDCSYTSASKYKLNLHVKVHKERRFNCAYCSSKFTLNCRLNQHVKLAHGENLPYKCSRCNVTFSSTNLLSWHVDNKHPQAAFHSPLYSEEMLEMDDKE